MRSTKNDISLAAGKQGLVEGDSMGRVVAMLKNLQEAVRNIGDQLSGTQKSHYTVEEVAWMTGRAPYTVRAWIKQKRVKAERVTGTGPRGGLRVPREELKKLIVSGKGENVPAVAAN